MCMSQAWRVISALLSPELPLHVHQALLRAVYASEGNAAHVPVWWPDRQRAQQHNVSKLICKLVVR